MVLKALKSFQQLKRFECDKTLSRAFRQNI
nr:MAG TPA: hypothetical protein [Caudoviricetes sp.]